MDDLYIFIGIIGAFYLTLIIMRLTGAMRKKRCPKCNHKLQRRKKALGDYIIKGIVLNILPFNRYKCIHCSWDGLRWNTERMRKKQMEQKESRRKERYKFLEMENQA